MTDDDETLIGELFYVLTAQLEDLVGIAVDGQAKDARLAGLANEIASGAGQVAIIARAAAALAAAQG